MTTKLFDRWWEQYKPIKNPHSVGNAFDDHMFETYGLELKQVEETPINNVWTLIEADGEEYIQAGLRFVNRLGYFITKESWNNDQTGFKVYKK